MNKITMWYRNDDKTPEYNHYEEGWVESPTPTPKVIEQKGWGKSKWIKEYGYSIPGEYSYIKLVSAKEIDIDKQMI
jgi:hypothetical protein